MIVDKEFLDDLRGCGTIIKVADMEGFRSSGSSGSSQRSPSLINEPPGSRSVAARVIMVNVFPNPMGSAIMPP